MPHLTEATGTHRSEKMLALMDTLSLDALIFTSGDFFQFATNFHTDVQTWERPIFAVFPRNGSPFLLMNELSTNHVRFSTESGKLWVTDISFYAEHPRVSGRLPLLSQLPELLAARLRQAGLHRGRIGVEGGSTVLTALSRLLPEISLRPCTAECRSLRWQKHKEEIGIMEAISDLSDWLQDRYRENIREGRLVQELDLAMASLFVQEAAERFPGENLEIRTRSMSGPASSSPHGDGASCGQRIQRGDVIVNIIVPRLNGLAIENERTWFCGKPSKEQVALWTVARDANQAGIAAATTGNPVSAIDAAAQAVIEKAGYGDHIKHRTGHGMGITNHEFPDDMAFCFRPLLDNEVYSVEPGLYAFGLGGFRLDDTVVVGAQPRSLTKTLRTLDYATVA
jgi:Xaa-Pro aminopeptidase